MTTDYVPELCFIYNNMDKFITEKKIMTQGVSEPPVSILPAMSKVWENTFKSAIKKELGMDPSYRNQFGFHKGKSTIGAISPILAKRRALSAS